jgi:hypothetical protein
VIGFAVITGITVVSFTWLAEHALAQFSAVEKFYWWARVSQSEMNNLLKQGTNARNLPNLF